MYKTIKTFSFLTLLTLLAAVSWPHTQSTAAAPIMQSLTWQGEEFAQGAGADTAVSPTGLTLDDAAFTAVYTSDAIHTPISFNALVTSWEADVPTDTSLEIQVRTRNGSGEWSEWFHLHSHLDLVQEDDHENLSDMITVPEADETHDTIQFSVSFGRFNSLVAPELHSISFTFIDTTAGPTTEEMLAQQQALDAANGSKPTDGYPRPTVISREVWCISVDCDYTAGLEYDNASHMIVHHTVSSNTSSNWAATVRAIWSFHTYPASTTCTSCRGWGDIGYNYLIDLNGVIYEGHNNQDYLNLDVVGTHASGANTGSMGVSLIGTFTSTSYPGLPGIAPSEPMKTSLVELLSWKADQRDINVFDASDALPFVSGGRPNLMGHRDAFGTTECPGDQAHVLIPWLRDQVGVKIGLTDPYLYVNENSAQFTKSSATWYEGVNECGHNGHSYYTYSTTNSAESANWGIWRPVVPKNGRYTIEAYVPYCNTGRGETAGATYEIHHANGVTEVTRSHQQYVGLWVPLGTFDLTAGIDNFVYLDDLVTTDNDLGLWFDSLRLLEVTEPDTITAIAPADDSWTNNPQVAFSWDVDTASAVVSTNLTVSTDAAQTNKLVNQTWNTAVFSHTHNFAAEQPTLYWQVTAVIDHGSGITQTLSTPPRQLGIDTTEPTSEVTAVYEMSGGVNYLVVWTGSDALSGVASYELQYRLVGDTDWTKVVETTAVSALFTPPNPDNSYEIRVLATDVATNRQSADTPAAALGTDQAIPLPHAIMLPLVTR